MMKNNFSVLFYLKKPKNYVSGQMPIYIRITVDGVPKEVSSGKHCEPSRWNAKTSRLDGKKEDARTLNNYLNILERRIDLAHTDLVNEGKRITTEMLKNKYLGIEERPHNLLIAFQDHNDKVKALLGNGFTKGTLVKYNTTLKHIRSFIYVKYGMTDLPVSNVDYHFITEFDFYLRSVCKCANNSAVKHLKNLGKVIR